MWGHDPCRLAKAARYAQDVWSATTQSSLAVQAPRPCTHCWHHLLQLTVVYITHWLRSTMQDQQVGHNRNTMIFFYTHKVKLMNYSASLSELQVVFCHSSQSVRVRVVWNPFPQSVLLISPAITACEPLQSFWCAWKGFSGTNWTLLLKTWSIWNIYRSQS